MAAERRALVRCHDLKTIQLNPRQPLGFLVSNNCGTGGTNNCATIGSTCTYTGPGTYNCTCNTGYNGTGTVCTGFPFFSFLSFVFQTTYPQLLFHTAINNCTGGGTNNCEAGVSTCNSTGPGTFTCACISGYSGIGVTCTGNPPPFSPFFL